MIQEEEVVWRCEGKNRKQKSRKFTNIQKSKLRTEILGAYRRAEDCFHIVERPERNRVTKLVFVCRD